MDKLKGKSAIVTGATSGMGRAAAVLFAQEGASVVASGRDEERGAALVQEIRSAGGRAVFVAGDVSLLETNESLVARAALFLASSDSDWMTGTALTIDGGIMTGV